MRLHHVILIVLPGLTACAGGPRPIEDQNERFEVAGCSVAPPSGEGWWVQGHNDSVVVFLKDTGDDRHRVYASAGVMEKPFTDLNEFCAHLAEQGGRETERLKKPHPEFSVVETADPRYIKGHNVMEDHGLQGFEGQPFTTISDIRCYFLPDGRQFLMAFGQKYPVGEERPDHTEEGATFLGSWRREPE